MKKLMTIMIATLLANHIFAGGMFELRTDADVTKTYNTITRTVNADDAQAQKIKTLLEDSHQFIAELLKSGYSEKQFTDNRIFERQAEHIEVNLKQILTTKQYSDFLNFKKAQTSAPTPSKK